ncbi:Unconventional myosin-IXa [Nymphon striatum]|nr:Unconventional myosin-IXa [Nymphon striatum]
MSIVTSKRIDVTPVKIVKDKSPDEIKSPDIPTSFNKSGAFYKAKKHFRTFIGGSKKDKRGTITDESDESGCDEVSLSLSESLHDIPFSGTNGSSVHRQDSEESVVNTHTFKASTSFYKWEYCAYCQKSMSFLNQGYKCSVCKLMFHPKCSQQSHRLSCCYTTEFRNPRVPRKRKPSKGSDMKRTGKWNLTRTTEFTDPKDKIISDVSELKRLDTFILKKISEMNEIGGRRDTIVDVIFKRALKEFKANLISTYSVASLDGEICVRYKDLIDNFEQVMESVCKQENTSASFPSTMGLNAFRGFLDQFMNSLRAEEKPKTKVKKEKRKKVEQAVEYLGHKFVPVVVNIPTACESCSSFMWMMEKGLEDNKKVFGVSLHNLVTEDIKIPTVIERLISTIEMKGLYTEGIYRKSGSSTKVRALKEALEEDWEQVEFDLYAIHVLTATLKSFFREMPQPLMSFECYDSFLRTTDLSDFNERIQTIYSVMDSLPKHNFDLLERLVFHLSRVAQHESSNRMSPNALSIVFAPCILRTDKCMQAQDSLNDIAKQTTCVEYIIKEQLKKLKVTLADIDTLDIAYHTASNRLSSLRSSKIDADGHINTAASEDEEENILTQHIETLQHEKALLTTVLPALELKRASSDDDMLSTDVDSNAGSVDDISGYEEYAITFDLPVSPPAFLKHLTKRRASVPHRRLPSKFSRAYHSIQFSDSEHQSVKSLHDYFPYQDDSIISMYHQPIISMYEDDAIMV